MVEDYWQNISTYVHEPGFPPFPPAPNANILIKDTALVRSLLSEAALPAQKGGGDLQPSVVVQRCCQLYLGLDEYGKEEFFKILAREYGVHHGTSLAAAKGYIDVVTVDEGSKAALRAEQILRHAVVPLHDRFFDRVNRLPGGMKFLIDMRADLLVGLRE
ncbi:hypothetical protein BC937DRAFT_86894 [Endogone sp. FLAS-F59071]|nr:hypothetical protein BC937DRAFT_86894 [Endogone sp. FLAS-F59071]|eukprot:RUS12835.1 hypothetical protein BC937DRAFT_86894 [Endogone sp. FLAS-F59071]